MTTNEIMPFGFDGALVRAVKINNDPWFVASDVSSILGYRDAFNAVRHLDDDERGTRNVSTPSGIQEMTIISESGLYSLIFTSRKPEAKAFRKWVTSEVLPSIRKTGSYALPSRAALQHVNSVARLFGRTAAQKAWVDAGLPDYREMAEADDGDVIADLLKQAGENGLTAAELMRKKVPFSTRSKLIAHLDARSDVKLVNTNAGKIKANGGNVKPRMAYVKES